MWKDVKFNLTKESMDKVSESLKSDTPRTDAARLHYTEIAKLSHDRDASSHADFGYYVAAHLFKQLERELKKSEEDLRLAQIAADEWRATAQIDLGAEAKDYRQAKQRARLDEVQEALLSLVDKRPEGLYRVLLSEWLYSDEVAALLYKARLNLTSPQNFKEKRNAESTLRAGRRHWNSRCFLGLADCSGLETGEGLSMTIRTTCRRCGADWRSGQLPEPTVPAAGVTAQAVRQAIFHALDEASHRTPGLAWDFSDDEQRVDFADAVVARLLSND